MANMKQGGAAPAVEIQQLNKTFLAPGGWPWTARAGKVALHSLDLTIPAGQALAILGPNGAGKSTLLRILATLLQPTLGQVWVTGATLAAGAQVRRQVGWATGDDRAFYWPLSGAANLEFFAALQGLHGAVAHARIAQVLAAVGLTTVAGTAYRAYSSGMRQRLAIARALLHQPAVLLLDEPTRSLDPEAAESVRRLLRACHEGGQTLVWVTHNPAEAAAYCDRVIWLRGGRLVADRPAGDPAAITIPWQAAP
ncbi:MAG: ABC transporter ATP-binding protein [Chloroflexota bacterium]|nr:ABC transporter ATP-binding protein [Chloroflexota bacterium]